MKRDAIIEVVGPAGSGKSTLSEQLRGLAGAAPYAPSVRATWPVLLRRLPVVLPALLGQLIRGWTLRDIRHLLFHDAMVDDLVRRGAVGRGILVLDQGPIYSVLSAERYVLRGPAQRPLLQHYLATLDRFAAALDAVILLDASDETLANRIAARRQRHAVKGQSVRDVSGFFEEYRTDFERILEGIHRSHSVPILRIDTSERSAIDVASAAVAMLVEIGIQIGQSPTDIG